MEMQVRADDGGSYRPFQSFVYDMRLQRGYSCGTLGHAVERPRSVDHSEKASA